MRTVLILLGLSLMLTGCGDDVHNHPEKLVEVEKEVLVAQDFEGFYECSIVSAGVCDVASPPANCSTLSYLELYADANDRVTFETSGQSLNSINPDNGTLGTHPVIGERDLLVLSGKLKPAPRNYNYSSSTHDIEEDASGSNITGNRRTDVVVEKVSDFKLSVKINIFDGAVNSNINNIVATRELSCEKI